jgi:hypothetical protein
MSLADCVVVKFDSELYSKEQKPAVSPGSAHALRIPRDFAF